MVRGSPDHGQEPGDDLKLVRWVQHQVDPDPKMENAFPWRDRKAPHARVYGPYADDNGEVHPTVRADAANITAEMMSGKAYLTSIARAGDDSRLPGAMAGAMQQLWLQLEQDVAAEVRRRVLGQPARTARVTPGRMQAHHLRPHEHMLIGRWGLFLASDPTAPEQPALTQGRILGLYLGAVLKTDEDIQQWEDTYQLYPTYAMDLRAGRFSVMSAEGAANAIAFANTAITDDPTSPETDRSRVNAVFVQFRIRIADKYGRIRRENIMALVALDNAFDPHTNPHRIILAHYGDAYVKGHLRPHIKQEPQSQSPWDSPPGPSETDLPEPRLPADAIIPATADPTTPPFALQDTAGGIPPRPLATTGQPSRPVPRSTLTTPSGSLPSRVDASGSGSSDEHEPDMSRSQPDAADSGEQSFPPVPETVHQALQQTPNMAAGSAVVLWAAMLRHRQPLTIAQVIDSTVLDQSAVTSTRAAGRYVQVLRGQGLLVEQGRDGQAVRYEAVVPETWSESDQRAATGWLDRQPPSAPSGNIPPVPAAVHEALQQTTRVLPGSAVVLWAAMLRHRQPLTIAQVIDSTVLDQSAVTGTSAAWRYVQALRGQGLLVERGRDGQAVRYEAVVPETWPESDQRAATGWLDRQPPPVPSVNIPPVPAAVHEALQQTDNVLPGRAVVLWAAMLRHRQPLTIAQVIDSTVLDQSAVTGTRAVGRYVQVLRGQGLLVERGKDGKAVRYQAVVPPTWPESDRRAATDWLDRQPPPVPSGNIPPVPETVHEALQQTDNVLPGRAVVLWAAMLRHRQPLTTAQVIDSTVLDQSAVTGTTAAGRYVQALRRQGLLDEQGKDGQAMRYQAVVPETWSPPDQQAATDWLDRQPPPAPSGNIPPVPAAVHEALQQTDGVAAGSAVVLWAAMLRHRQPLTTAQVIDSTVLDQSAVTGTRAAGRYVQVLRGQGLLIEQGRDGQAMRYQAVVPEAWSSPERQAATGWLDRQPPPAPSGNIPPVPAAVHEALQQTPGVAAG
ncbi:hypothetical protein ABZ071_34940, partial [Micromonospora fulviviridis]